VSIGFVPASEGLRGTRHEEHRYPRRQQSRSSQLNRPEFFGGRSFESCGHIEVLEGCIVIGFGLGGREIADVIAKIAAEWPAVRWDEFMPWNWQLPQATKLAA